MFDEASLYEYTAWQALDADFTSATPRPPPHPKPSGGTRRSRPGSARQERREAGGSEVAGRQSRPGSARQERRDGGVASSAQASQAYRPSAGAPSACGAGHYAGRGLQPGRSSRPGSAPPSQDHCDSLSGVLVVRPSSRPASATSRQASPPPDSSSSSYGHASRQPSPPPCSGWSPGTSQQNLEHRPPWCPPGRGLVRPSSAGSRRSPSAEKALPTEELSCPCPQPVVSPCVPLSLVPKEEATPLERALAMTLGIQDRENYLRLPTDAQNCDLGNRCFWRWFSVAALEQVLGAKIGHLELHEVVDVLRKEFQTNRRQRVDDLAALRAAQEERAVAERQRQELHMTKDKLEAVNADQVLLLTEVKRHGEIIRNQHDEIGTLRQALKDAERELKQARELKDSAHSALEEARLQNYSLKSSNNAHLESVNSLSAEIKWLKKLNADLVVKSKTGRSRRFRKRIERKPKLNMDHHRAR